MSDVYRCSRCPSEFLFRIEPYESNAKEDIHEATHSLEVIYAIDLGPCRTPHSRYWRALTSKSDSKTVSTEPFPLAWSKPIMHYALDWPDTPADREHKVVALTH